MFQRSAGSALNGIYNKIFMKFSRDNFVAGLYDGRSAFLIQDSDLAVGDRSGLFDIRQTVDDLRCACSVR